MILQNIVFPMTDTCTEEKMYFRKPKSEKTDIEYSFGSGFIKMQKGASVGFDTYFNSFSAEKWYKYTRAGRIKLTLRLSGKFRITLMRKDRTSTGEVLTEIINKRYADSKGEDKEYTFEYSTTSQTGLYCFEAAALSYNAKIYGGHYSTDIGEEDIKRVKIAIDICTFRREKFIEANIAKLKRCFLENEASYLYDKLMIFVSDNAHTLDIERIQTDKVRIFQNKNVGGAGGFTRGMIEISDVREAEGITHILVMDDDLTLDPEAIFRTVTLLSIIKDEYADAFVGGSMIRLDCKYKQVEAGAAWNGGDINAFKAGLDLREVSSCIYNETEESSQYNAWWYCVFPAGVVNDNNLPLPIFIRGDDIEYGLRNMKRLILLNGICVWHEPFENKYSSFLFYYILRNRLIDNSIHHITIPKKALMNMVRIQVLDEVRLYRYGNANLLMRGVEDFLKGVGWLKAQDGEALHKSIMDEGYKLKFIEDLDEKLPFVYSMFEASVNQLAATGFKARLINHFTMNGLYLKPNRGYNIVSTVGVQQSSIYRRSIILNYDYASKKGFVTRHDKAAAKQCVKRLKQLNKLIESDYERAVKDYEENSRQLMTREFWNSYLGI